MDLPTSKPFRLLPLTLIFLFSSHNAHNFPSFSTVSDANHKNLIYARCSNHTFPDPTGSLQQILSSLFEELGVQGSISKFYETSVGDDDIAISGLFQCRNDLSTDECSDCVNRIPEMSRRLCGGRVPAKIQAAGCYMRYDDGDGDNGSNPGLELQHKACSESKATASRFEEVRDNAFAAAEIGIVSGGGFCETRHGAMRVVAQCEGRLEGCDCGVCVSNAAAVAQDQCGYSLQGEVYLDGCFISYSYNENGNRNTGKLVAIVVGAAAALLFGLLFLYLLKSCTKKTEDDW